MKFKILKFLAAKDLTKCILICKTTTNSKVINFEQFCLIITK